MVRLHHLTELMVIMVFASILFCRCTENPTTPDNTEKKKNDDQNNDAGTTYSIIYYANSADSGNVPDDATEYHDGDTVTVLGNINGLQRQGDNFEGWNTSSAGTETTYHVNDTFIMAGSDVHLYAQWTPCYPVGSDGPGGGYVFYDKGEYTDGWRYMEISKTDQSTGMVWCSNQQSSYLGTTGAIGDGPDNVTLILVTGGTSAAKTCDQISLGGKTDWFLPSFYELKAVPQNLPSAILATFPAEQYWSSTESDGTWVKTHRIQYVSSGIADKRSSNPNVRAIRRF